MASEEGLIVLRRMGEQRSESWTKCKAKAATVNAFRIAGKGDLDKRDASSKGLQNKLNRVSG